MFQIVELVDRIAPPVPDSELGQDLGFAHRGDIAGPVETLCRDGLMSEHAELLRVNVRGFSQISVQRIDRLRGREVSEGLHKENIQNPGGFAFTQRALEAKVPKARPARLPADLPLTVTADDIERAGFCIAARSKLGRQPLDDFKRLLTADRIEVECF